MPESPATQELEVIVPDVPMRDGEKERFGATLNLEDQRRKEALREELTKQLRDLGQDSAKSEMIARVAKSPSARKRQQAVMRKVKELRSLTRKYGDTWEGPCAPATVINLNPVELRLYGQLQRYTMPPAGKGQKIELKFRGRVFVGSYMTLSTPEVWLAHTGIELDPIADSPSMEARYCPPAGLAYQFYSHYCVGASDAQGIGGIIIFEGDIHTLSPKNLQRTGKIVRVPFGEPSPDLPGEVVYSTTERPLDEYLADELERQRMYAEAVIAEGHTYGTSTDSDERKKLNNLHKVWHNYALECGYIKKAYAWASSKLETGPLQGVVYCPDCRSEQEDPEQFFCRKCNAPFDAHKAFMAGKQVSPDRLAVYAEDSKEFKDILREIKHRRKRLALLGLGEETKGKTEKDE